jgi:hypothetical protein
MEHAPSHGARHGEGLVEGKAKVTDGRPEEILPSSLPSLPSFKEYICLAEVMA